MKTRFSIGDKVKLTLDALQNENYSKIGQKTLTVEHVARQYMPASEFYRKGRPAGFHPGYDSSSGCALYDCTGSNLSFYEWELEPA